MASRHPEVERESVIEPNTIAEQSPSQDAKDLPIIIVTCENAIWDRENDVAARPESLEIWPATSIEAQSQAPEPNPERGLVGLEWASWPVLLTGIEDLEERTLVFDAWRYMITSDVMADFKHSESRIQRMELEERLRVMAVNDRSLAEMLDLVVRTESNLLARDALILVFEAIEFVDKDELDWMERQLIEGENEEHQLAEDWEHAEDESAGQWQKTKKQPEAILENETHQAVQSLEGMAILASEVVEQQLVNLRQEEVHSPSKEYPNEANTKWDEMVLDEGKKLTGCKKPVYEISDIAKAQAEEFLEEISDGALDRNKPKDEIHSIQPIQNAIDLRMESDAKDGDKRISPEVYVPMVGTDSGGWEGGVAHKLEENAENSYNHRGESEHHEIANQNVPESQVEEPKAELSGAPELDMDLDDTWKKSGIGEKEAASIERDILGEADNTKTPMEKIMMRVVIEGSDDTCFLVEKRTKPSLEGEVGQTGNLVDSRKAESVSHACGQTCQVFAVLLSMIEKVALPPAQFCERLIAHKTMLFTLASQASFIQAKKFIAIRRAGYCVDLEIKHRGSSRVEVFIQCLEELCEQLCHNPGADSLEQAYQELTSDAFIVGMKCLLAFGKLCLQESVFLHGQPDTPSAGARTKASKKKRKKRNNNNKQDQAGSLSVNPWGISRKQLWRQRLSVKPEVMVKNGNQVSKAGEIMRQKNHTLPYQESREAAGEMEKKASSPLKTIHSDDDHSHSSASRDDRTKEIEAVVQKLETAIKWIYPEHESDDEGINLYLGNNSIDWGVERVSTIEGMRLTIDDLNAGKSGRWEGEDPLKKHKDFVLGIEVMMKFFDEAQGLTLGELLEIKKKDDLAIQVLGPDKIPPFQIKRYVAQCMASSYKAREDLKRIVHTNILSNPSPEPLDVFNFTQYLNEAYPGETWTCERLPDSVMNYTVRATRHSDSPADDDTYILKFGPPFIAALGSDAPAPLCRQAIEAFALRKYGNWPSDYADLTEDEDEENGEIAWKEPFVLVPELTHLDTNNHVLVMQDLGKLFPLPTVLGCFFNQTWEVIIINMECVAPFRDLGDRLGMFFAHLHEPLSRSDFSRGSGPKLFKKSSMRDLVRTDKVVPIGSYLEVFGVSNHHELGERIIKDFDADFSGDFEVYTFGDATLSSVLIQWPIKKKTQNRLGLVDWEFSGPGRGINGDMAQLLAELYTYTLAPKNTKLSMLIIQIFMYGLVGSYRETARGEGSTLIVSKGKKPTEYGMNRRRMPPNVVRVLRSAFIAFGRELIYMAFNVPRKCWCCPEDSTADCEWVHRMVGRGVWFLEMAGRNENDFQMKNWKEICEKQHGDFLLGLVFDTETCTS